MDIQEVLGMGAGWEVGGDTAGTPTDPYSFYGLISKRF